jgi:hypothetical protein
MNGLAEIYKQAHELVLKKYDDEPEDRWRVNSIFRSRLGEKGHESVMFQFVKDIESTVDELLKTTIPTVSPTDVVLPTVSPTVAPNVIKMNSTETQPLTADNPKGIDLDWN